MKDRRQEIPRIGGSSGTRRGASDTIAERSASSFVAFVVIVELVLADRLVDREPPVIYEISIARKKR